MTRRVGGGADVWIEGLDEFYRALKRASDLLPETTSKLNYEAANEIVRSAKSRAAGEPGSARKAARSLRASKASSSASIRGGGGGYPFFHGAEFGSVAYKQFQSWRGNQFNGWSGGPGYFLHPAIREDGPQILEKYLDEINDAALSQAFND